MEVEELNNQEVNQAPGEDERKLVIDAKSLHKPYWFIIKLKGNIEIVEEGGLSFPRHTESIVAVQFDETKEANEYFALLDKQENLDFTILHDYTKL